MLQLVTLHFRSMLGFTVPFILLSLVESCQEINVKAKDGGVIVGRSAEFGVPLDYFLITEPAGTKHVAPALPKCPGDPFTFSNRYKQIMFKGIFRGKWTNTYDGINAAGLSASVLYFKDNAEYIDPAEITGVACDNAIPQTMVAAYILAMYKTVQQVKNDLESEEFPVVWEGYELGFVMPVHFNIIDKSGAGLVLEHVKGEGVKWYDNTVGVLTNSPPYSWHMTNLRNYPHFQRNDKGREGFKYSSQGEDYSYGPQWTGSGMLGLPGDYTSPSRFVKAATILALAPKPATTNEAIVQIFHHMAAADIPYGVVETSPLDLASFTWCILVKDLERRCVYYRAYTDLSVKKLCLDDIPDVQSAVKMEGRFEDGFRDVAGELKDFNSIVSDI